MPDAEATTLEITVTYDAASQEIARVSLDKIKIWTEECQSELLKEKCNFFNSGSNCIAIFGIFITLIITLLVTTFNSDLIKGIYVAVSAFVFFFLCGMSISCYRSYRKRNSEKFSDCIIRKIKENSIEHRAPQLRDG